MIQEASKFFRDVAAPSIGGPISMIQQLNRMDFLGGAGVATLFLIEKVATTAFYLVANLFTCFNNKSFMTALQQSGKMIPVYATAIPLGIIGALFPNTINEKVLEIPARGLIVQHII